MPNIPINHRWEILERKIMIGKEDNIRTRKFGNDLIVSVQECINLSSIYPNVGLFVCPIDLDVLVVARPDTEGEGLFAYDRVEWKVLVTNNKPNIAAIKKTVKDIESKL